jgi:hypothetical protein
VRGSGAAARRFRARMGGVRALALADRPFHADPAAPVD